MTPKKLYTLTFWRLCLSALLFFMSFNIIIAELNEYIHDLQGDLYKGWIIALFTLAAMISRPFSGIITDTLGRVPVMIFGALVAGGISWLYPVFPTLMAFLWLRFFHGFSTGFTPTGLTTYVADIVPRKPKRRGHGCSWVFQQCGNGLRPQLGQHYCMAMEHHHHVLGFGRCGHCHGFAYGTIKRNHPSTRFQTYPKSH